MTSKVGIFCNIQFLFKLYFLQNLICMLTFWRHTYFLKIKFDLRWSGCGIFSLSDLLILLQYCMFYVLMDNFCPCFLCQNDKIHIAIKSTAYLFMSINVSVHLTSSIWYHYLNLSNKILHLIKIHLNMFSVILFVYNYNIPG